MTGALRIAELCAGYSGLSMGVEAVAGGDVTLVADIDPGAAAILSWRYPDVPNLGDIGEADWFRAGAADILCAGFPCQDVSAAGARAGLKHGNRSGVWHQVARAIGVLRPSLVLIENVRGLLTARGDEPADEHLAEEAKARTLLNLLAWTERAERIARAKGDTEGAGKAAARAARVMGARKRALARCAWHERRLVRAIGTVLGSLADLGFDAEWVCLPASDAGAPHRRERVFILAWPAADASGDRSRGGGHAGTSGRLVAAGRLAEDPDGAARGERRLTAPGQAACGRPRADTGRPGGAHPAADAEGLGGSDGPVGGRAEQFIAESGTGGGDHRGPGTARTGRDGSRARVVASPADADDNGCEGRPELDGGQAPGLDCGHRGHPDGRGDGPERLEGESKGSAPAVSWGPYAPAIKRWETVLGRPAPSPTEPGRTGERLSPRFVEWLMGLPEGWVTDVPGLSRNAQLKALGNGCVPQQVAMAVTLLLARVPDRVRASLSGVTEEAA